MRTATFTVVTLVLLAVLVSSLLPTLPVLAGGLLTAGAALASWAGWKVGVARRPRLATVPVITTGTGTDAGNRSAP
jgi:threonine/homoserine/homoserine lactone efflux protein